MKNLYINLVTLLAYSVVKNKTVGWIFYSRVFLIAAVVYYFVFYR